MKLHNLIFSVIFIQLFSQAISEFPQATTKLGCRDEGGNLIDWFYLYKLPNTFDNDGEVHRTVIHGLSYMFVTPTSNSKWIYSRQLINESTSMPGMTLAEIYNNGDDDNLVIMYNDDPPNEKSDGARGHTKGVVVANEFGGFWLIHSVPNFPPDVSDGAYNYPSTANLYGQSFLCISMNTAQLRKVGKQLQFNEPHFFSSSIPDHLQTIYPELVQALAMKPIKTPPFYNIETIQSRGGSNFLSFAKSRKFQKELYEDLVAPFYDSGDYYVETWRHGSGNIESDCSKPSKVYNIEQVQFKSTNITFKTMRDHSKWMVSDEKELICVGDINRQEHQKVRGGGTVCQQQTKVSAVYSDLISGVESCRRNRVERTKKN